MWHGVEGCGARGPQLAHAYALQVSQVGGTQRGHMRLLRLQTSSIRCTPAEMFDMRLNSHSRLNLIRALLEAIDAGADEALMLDPHGFVSSCNATNFFFVSDAGVKTSRGDYCFHGVTRANVIALCQAHGIPLELGDYTLADLARAQEAFVTGSFGGITPVCAIDGKSFAGALPGPITRLLCAHYEALKDHYAELARWLGKTAATVHALRALFRSARISLRFRRIRSVPVRNPLPHVACQITHPFGRVAIGLAANGLRSSV